MSVMFFSADICFSSQLVPKYYLFHNVSGLFVLYVFMLAK